jgi:hypothetical protein
MKFEEWLVLKSEKFYHMKDMRMFEDVVMKCDTDEEVKKGFSMTPALEQFEYTVSDIRIAA